jgi:hypothetical protein
MYFNLLHPKFLIIKKNLNYHFNFQEYFFNKLLQKSRLIFLQTYPHLFKKFLYLIIINPFNYFYFFYISFPFLLNKNFFNYFKIYKKKK